MFCDGFDHITTIASMGLKWDRVALDNAPGPTYGRFGSGGLNVVLFGGGYAEKQVPSSNTVIVHAAYNWHLYSGVQTIFKALNTTGVQFSFQQNADGTIGVYRGDIVTLLGTTSAISQDTWVQLSFKIVVSDTVGTVEIRLNNVAILTLTAQDTQGQAAGGVTKFSLFSGTTGGGQNTQRQYWDDFIYSTENDAAPFNDFMVDQRIQTLFPDGNGSLSQLVRTGGDAAGNYTAVDDPTPDSDTSYVATAVAGNTDLYPHTNLSATAQNVKAVVVTALIRKDDAGERTYGAVVKSGATQGVGAAATLPSSYRYNQTAFLTNPATAVAWTPAEVNAMEAGVKAVT